MELMCPHCHANNDVAADGADEARFVCADCGAQFEAMLVEGALVPLLPLDSGTPGADFFDNLNVSQGALAETPPALEGVFVVAGEAESHASGESPAEEVVTPAHEVDPFHITEDAAGGAESSGATAVTEKAQPAPAVFHPAPAVDKYAVGMRVLRISPMWLLLSSVGFFAVLLMMSWVSQPVVPVGEAVAQLPNQATSPATPPAAVAQVEEAKAAAESSLPARPRASAGPSEEEAEAASPAGAATSAAASAAPPTARAELSGQSSGSGSYTVQVGSYNIPSEANEHVSRLRGAGVEARAVAAELPKRGTWYRVQAGRFETREEAARAGAQLRAQGLAAGAIVTTVASSQ